MEKHLQRYGNSLALVIEKPILRALGIGRNTKLTMRTDGRRLIIEPLPDVFEPVVDPDVERLKLDANEVATRLLREHKMWQPQVDRLWPGCWSPLLYTSRAEGWSSGTKATEDDVQTMHRMETCLLALQDKKSWDEAIEAALQRWPVTCRDRPNS
jgi:antitoxin component of MazEF toxin-antitoxin module